MSTNETKPEPAPTKPSRSWLSRLQPIFGLAILATVAAFLPWKDQLIVKEAGDSRSIQGQIEGDWQSEQIGFQPGPKFEPETSELPAPGPDGGWDLRRSSSGKWGTETFAGELDLRPGLPRIFRSVEPGGLTAAMGFFLVALLCGVTRWWRLLRISGAGTRWLDCFRLTFLGLFFNLVMPGLTGGDVVKAVLAVKENPGRRTDALISVVIDRLFGLFTLVLLAAVVLWVLGETFAEIRWPVTLLAVFLIAAASMYIHRGLRRAVRFEALLGKLPLGKKLQELDQAVLRYAAHPLEVVGALALSFGNHFGAIAGVMALGAAFGVGADAVGWLDWVAIVPVANMVSAIPVAPSGWGVGEAAYAFLFDLVGASPALGVAVSIGFRLCQLLLGVLGGLFLLRPGARHEISEIQTDL